MKRGPRAGRTRRLAVGVTGRLVVLVLLPLVVLTMVSAPLAARTHGEAQRAQSGEREVPAMTAAIGALAAVVSEQGESEVVLQSVESGFPLPVASAVLGIDLEGEFRSAQAATDRVIGRLPAALAAPVRSGLAALRASIVPGRVTAVQVDARYEQIEAVLEAASVAKLATVAQRMAGSGSMTRPLLTFGWCNYLVEAAAAQARDDTAVWFAAATDRPQAMVKLAHDNALFDEAGQRIATSGLPNVTAAWTALVADPSARQYTNLLVAGEQGLAMPFTNGTLQPSSHTISLATLAGAVKGIPAHWRLISDVVAQASATVRKEARSLAGSNTRAYERWVTLMAVAALAALAFAVIVARSISRPLGRLATAAGAVVDGRLDIDRLPTDGPRQTRVVADAFNALLSNLRLLEAKTEALATCDFDNAVLSAPLPGRLGASLQDSVRVLAGSIQDRQQLEERLVHDATHDALTGLLNRAAAITNLDQALARARRQADRTALLYIDLDNFKRANDLQGHQTGDHILREVGNRLAATVRAGDVVARLGGDEFIVIAERIEGTEEATVLARRLIGAPSEPIDTGTVTLCVGGSIGITIAHGGGDAMTLLAQADLALYQAKQGGGGTVDVYNDALQERLARRDAIERSLRDELARGGGGLVLHFQPLVDTSKVVRGVEALLRWDRPGQGLLSPDQFIPVAEASDLIIAIDKWVLATAARQIAAWSTDPVLHAMHISVHISGRHLLSNSLPANVERVLHETGIDPQRLTVEITETVLLDDLTAAADQLEAVRRLGVHVAVDDFGTGYTSLAHLQQLPVDSVKIDRTFISEIQHPDDAALVRMITELAHHLGLVTVTEGVETDEQFRALQMLGTDHIQGYLIARPMPLEQLRTWIEETSGDPLDQLDPTG